MSIAHLDPVADQRQKRQEDVHWAQHDPQVENSYGGQWVVPYEGRIVAHGTNPQDVLQEASRITRLDVGDLLVCAIPQARSWLADA